MAAWWSGEDIREIAVQCSNLHIPSTEATDDMRLVLRRVGERERSVIRGLARLPLAVALVTSQNKRVPGPACTFLESSHIPPTSPCTTVPHLLDTSSSGQTSTLFDSRDHRLPPQTCYVISQQWQTPVENTGTSILMLMRTR
jgi:hypothetical protein